MFITYDDIDAAFLQKIREYDFLEMDYPVAQEIVDGYRRRAVSKFKKMCNYNLTSSYDDCMRMFSVEIKEEDSDEIVDIVSDGMTVQWLKQYVNNEDNLRNDLNTRDYTGYSPAELQKRIRESYNSASKEFIQEMRDYSYNHGDLTELHS